MPEARLEKTREAYPPCVVCGWRFAAVGDLCGPCADGEGRRFGALNALPQRLPPAEPTEDDLWGV